MSGSEGLGGRFSRGALYAYVGLVQILLLAPIAAITLGSLTTTQYVVFPPVGLTLQWYSQVFDRPEMIDSFGLSLGIAGLASTVAGLVGLAVSIALIRYRTRMNVVLWLLVVSSMMMPSVVLGFGFLQTYTRIGIGGTVFALIAGHIVLVTPYAVTLIGAGLRLVNPTLEEAARSLGASRLRTFRHVTLPLVSWSLVVGWGLAFLVSFSDASISIFLNTPRVVTLPVRIFDALRFSPLDPQLTAVASGLVIVTLIVLFASARFINFDRLTQQSTKDKTEQG
ncbi:putative spermidine/putrescine transport system permease protein [Rhodoligotrophos appendicifer]|uniref:ABC transporter permease n=1 Tax=Rhodoligotrophos appendicifer TaxID=987056 RepID=UPI0014785982|nr:ABC transporter permease [Rhodoligotrophos appendicifer]